MKSTLIFLFVMLSMAAFSQERVITGNVSDTSGEDLLSVTVLIKGTGKGTITDLEGNYSIKVKSDDVLLFSFLGFETQEVVVGDRTIVNVSLSSDSEALDELVVVGYGTVKKSDLTGSVASIKGDELTQAGAIGLDQALAGRAAGVTVTQSSGELGSGASVRIRGISSLNGSEPLYIIDGVPIDNVSADGLTDQSTESSSLSPLAMINPSDIKSIEILKDASSTAIYGSRGANGVVLITTNSGNEGKGIITVDYEYGMTEVANYVDVLDANQYTINKLEANRNWNGSEYSEGDLAKIDSANAGTIASTNWQDAIFRMGNTSNVNVSFSGGNKDMRYLVSTGFLDSEGIVMDTDYKRASARVNLNANLTKRLKAGVKINYSHVTSNQKAISTGGNSLRGQTSAISRALRASPTTGLDADDEDEGIDLWTPQTALEANNFSNLLTQLVGSMDLQYNISKTLYFKTAFTYQNRNTAQRYYQMDVLPNNVAEGGRAKTGDKRDTKTSFTNTLNYKKKIKRNSINVVLGQSTESAESEGVYMSNFGFANDLLTYYDPGSAAFYDPDRVTYSDNNLASFFGRVNYTYNKKYLFTLTGRYDGSSKFSVNNKWAFFPAAAFAYKLSEEKFIKRMEDVSEMKFRVSYGSSGNQAISSYQSLEQYESGLTAFNETTSTIYYACQLPNENLTWETTKQLDAGIDIGLFENRVNLSFDYYNKLTDDLLFKENRIPVQSGHSTYTENYGSLETNGFEVSAAWRIFDKRNFQWSVNGNFSMGKTTVKNMASDYLFSGWDPGYIPGGTQRLIIGEEIGTFYGYKTAGIAQFDDFVEFQGVSDVDRIAMYNADPTATYTFVDDFKKAVPNVAGQQRPGEQLYEDIDEDGTFSDGDRTIIGQAQPDIVFGLSNTFNIFGVDVSVFVDGQQGKDIAAIQNFKLLSFDGKQNLALATERWTPENPSNLWPRLSRDNNNQIFSDRIIEDGSFIRIKNVTVGYNLPKSL